jgi:cytochrome c553
MLIALLPLGVSVSDAYGADREAGRRKAEACAACHGAGGVSGNPAVPSIAAQPRQFVTTQLVMFREGNRKDPLMSPVAATLSNADINDIAEYLSSLPLAPSTRAADDGRRAAGKRLTEQYNCVQCHGPELRGQQHIPRLAGQQRDYLLTQLRGFIAGTRFDMDGNMSAAVQRLPDADAQLLAEYLSALK